MRPEADALLDAIFDSPDDDTPRLVYADWLTEYGFEDYAQFIRLSVKADGGSKPPQVRQQLREERHQFWQHMQAQTGAFAALPLTVHSYHRGFCFDVVGKAEDVLRTAREWWPFITPPKLTVFDTTGREAEAVGAIVRHASRLRELRIYSRPGMDVHDIDEYGFQPLNSSVFTALSAPGVLPRLRSLKITIAQADLHALRAFAASELPTRLDSLWIEVRFDRTDRYRIVSGEEKQRPGRIQQAFAEFFAEYA
jgi:uncharacterized protein (TIGR02996 family)